MTTTIAGYPYELGTLAAHELRALDVHLDAGRFRVLEGDERERLYAAMKSGYDAAHPIVCWSKKGEIVDGRNRRDLAVELGLARCLSPMSTSPMRRRCASS